MVLKLIKTTFTLTLFALSEIAYSNAINVHLMNTSSPILRRCNPEKIDFRYEVRELFEFAPERSGNLTFPNNIEYVHELFDPNGKVVIREADNYTTTMLDLINEDYPLSNLGFPYRIEPYEHRASGMWRAVRTIIKVDGRRETTTNSFLMDASNCTVDINQITKDNQSIHYEIDPEMGIPRYGMVTPQGECLQSGTDTIFTLPLTPENKLRDVKFIPLPESDSDDSVPDCSGQAPTLSLRPISPSEVSSYCEFNPQDEDCKTVVVDEGLWGEWTDWKHCPPNTFSKGFNIAVAPNRGTKDDTGMNSIRLTCVDQLGENVRQISAEGPWGEWGTQQTCPDKEIIKGGALRLNPNQGYGTCNYTYCDNDDTSAEDFQALCSDETQLFSSNGSGRGNWGSLQQCPEDHAVCGLRARISPDQGRGDDTALNGLEFRCCPIDQGWPITLSPNPNYLEIIKTP